MADKVIVEFIAQDAALLQSLEEQKRKFADVGKSGKKANKEQADGTKQNVHSIQELEAELKKLTIAYKKSYSLKEMNEYSAKIKQTKGQIAELTGATKELDKTQTRSIGTIGKIGAGLTAAYAVGVIKNFLSESIRLADFQMKAERALLVALNNRKSAQELLIKQASNLQKITVFGDEQIIQAQTMLALLNKDENVIRRLTPLVLDLASAKGMDLSTAADLVSKSIGSSTNALSRYGIQITGAVGSTERLDSAVVGLTAVVGGQAVAMAGEGASAIQQYENALGDLKEEIGKGLMPALSVLFKSLTKDIIPAFRTLFHVLGEMNWYDFINPIYAVSKIMDETKKQLNLEAERKEVEMYGDALNDRFNLAVRKGGDAAVIFGRAIKEVRDKMIEGQRAGTISAAQLDEYSKVIERLRERYISLVTPQKKIVEDLTQEEIRRRRLVELAKNQLEAMERYYNSIEYKQQAEIDRVRDLNIALRESQELLAQMREESFTFTPATGFSDEQTSGLNRTSTSMGFLQEAEQAKRRLQLLEEYTIQEEEVKAQIKQEFYDSGLSDFAAFLQRKKDLEIKSAQDVAQAEKDLKAKTLKDIKDQTFAALQQTNEAIVGLIRRQNDNEFTERLQGIDQRNRSELDNLRGMLDAKKISQEEYEQRVRQLQAQTDAEQKRLRIEQAQRDKRLAIASASINLLGEVIKLGVVTPQAIAAAIAGAIQLGFMAATPIPTFHDGGVVGNDAKMTTGQLKNDEVFAKLQVGERIVDRQTNKKYNEVLEAIAGGNFERYLYSRFILPSIAETGGHNVSHSVTAKLKDANIVAGLKAIQRTERDGFNAMLQTMNKRQRRGLLD